MIIKIEKRIRKIFVALLILGFFANFFSNFPFKVLAAKLGNDQAKEIILNPNNQDNIAILEEVKEARTTYEKTFKKSDGSLEVYYYERPIHEYIEDKGFEELKKDVIAYMDEVYPDKNITFKVESRRAKKTYPKKSMEINYDLGEAILYAFPEIRVDVHHPDVLLHVEVREEIYIYSEIIPGPGGMPIGTNGTAMLLLSGGIDSPVAGYMISKRGVGLEATYFHAPPYTSERAKQKVVDLAKQVSKYTGPIKLHVVNFTDIQLYIYEKCPHDELTIIMRRYMMRIAEHFAKEDGCLGLITGESIGQVASQTMQSLMATNDVCTLPVYRPLIGFDKQEIVDISEKIGTYETSILPYEDCCTIFVAKHPVTKPNVEVIRKSEENLSEKIDELFAEAVNTVETIIVK